MFYSILFLCELTILFFLSRKVSASLFSFLLKISKSQKFTINFISTLFLPGVIIHELSHTFMAGLLFVKAYDIEFLPRLRDNEIKLGSVTIAQTDLFRRFIIGAAPLLSGLGIIVLLFYYLSPFNIPLISWQMLILLYVLFQIGNTMFSSRKDMEGALGVLVFVVIGILLIWLLRIQIPSYLWSWIFTPAFIQLFLQLDIMLGIIIGVDGVTIATSHVRR